MKKKVIQHKYNDWLPLKSEIGANGKAIPHFEDNGGKYKDRIFPQFTLSNIKTGKVLPSSSALVKAGLSDKRRSCLNHITFIFFANAITYI